jgi:hypothetical protein
MKPIEVGHSTVALDPDRTHVPAAMEFQLRKTTNYILRGEYNGDQHSNVRDAAGL